MKPSGLIAACLSVLAVLAGCDSGNPTIAQQAHTAAATGSVPGTQAYEDSVQRIYLAYFGRPADPAGLAYFEGLLQNAGAPVDLPSLSQAYMQPGGVHDIIEVFSSSRARSQQRCDSVAIVHSGPYRHLLLHDGAADAGPCDLRNQQARQ